MATFKITGGVNKFHDELIDGMIARGYSPEFAEKLFKQIEGFGSYGFPESHAASFALIAYASSWMKCHHPDVFACALLNAQPMGFYAPAQIVRDARQHGVQIRPIDINESRWDCTLEQDGRLHALRLGLRMVKGLSDKEAAALITHRITPYDSIANLHRRTRLPVGALEHLAEADAFASLGIDRRQALWNIRALAPADLPLFAERNAPRPRGGRGLSQHRPHASPTPGEFPARRSGRPGHGARVRPAGIARRPSPVGRRHRARAPEAG
jgi:error-prone DNA polymerase